ncbi:MAG: dephospho-CoA kinase [Eggerthellaceae bacterium]|nr:dephospho-CoA kinase [Eggerthellaceae bacterium]
MQLKIQNSNTSAPYRIFVIGGIGAGKSSVCKALEGEYGFPVIDLDNVGHKILEDAEVVQKLRVAFSQGIFSEGNVDRKKLAEFAFSSAKNRAELEKITHPAILKRAEGLVDILAEKSNSSTVVIEVSAFRPENFEKYYYCDRDKIVLVTANFKSRIERLKTSRNISEEQIKLITEHQLSDKEFKKFSDIVIENSLDFEELNREICIFTDKISQFLTEESDPS